MQSEQINELAAALVAAQAEFSAVPKDSANPFFKSKYAALPDVVKHTSPVLAKYGLAISQHITCEDGRDALTTFLIHKSGQYLSSTMLLHMVKDDPQAQGSAVTYARRYSYMAALGLVADDDDDGNSASQPRSFQKPAQSAPRAPIAEPTGDVPADIKTILEAAKVAPGDEFLNSLAQQYSERGSLSDKQVAAGKKKAYGVLKTNAVAESAVADQFPNSEAFDERPF